MKEANIIFVSEHLANARLHAGIYASSRQNVPPTKVMARWDLMTNRIEHDKLADATHLVLLDRKLGAGLKQLIGRKYPKVKLLPIAELAQHPEGWSAALAEIISQ
ncbi:hypothetical protein HY995_03905 [Candidatus Micrarchaeota archaeon]|nr:hypothetical protein [Candidatus Micrarchaeota archaeon]MBI5177203.1 hypothetical protein [Candidatus Micrarchaeota archaeon]